jgi:Golgi phosphoprotein 3
MSSDSGLKQRKIAAASTSDSRYNQHNDPENNSEKENNSDDGNEEYDADSKEARLTLMEEILLLGLKDREVCQKLPFFQSNLSHKLTR